MASRTLITGITGFAGGWLAETLLARGETQLVGVSRHDWPQELSHLREQVVRKHTDLCDASAVATLIRDIEPTRIFHLAGYAHAGRSLREPDAAWATNLQATQNVYDAVVRWGGKPRIVYVSSGLIYGGGRSADDRFSETAEFRPTSPYASSKAAADLLSYEYSITFGLDIVRARPFNHTGPRQSPEYVVPSFARQIVAIERGERPPLLETGNLTPRRDLTDVRDVVDAYCLLAERGRSGEAYNIARGEAVPISTILERLLACSSIQVQVRPQAGLVRGQDIAIIRGDATRLRSATGWQPRYSLDRTLADTLEYWRRRPVAG